MSPTENWTAEEVARWLGYSSADQFARKREALHSEYGFPRPLPGIGRLLWSAMSLSAWQASLIEASARKALAEIGGPLDPNSVVATPAGEAAWDKLLNARLEGRAA